MNSHQPHADTVPVVLHEPGGASPAAPVLFELCEPVEAAQAEAVAARLALRHRSCTVSLDDDGTGRHLLRLTPDATAPLAARASAVEELLADLLQPPGAESIPVTGHQRDLLTAALASPAGPGRHVEQLCWTWAGPLNVPLFTAAWQSVADREAVLRASFDWTAAPRLVIHEHASLEIARHTAATIGWSELLRRDREREFALHRPGLLRLSLLDGPHTARATTRVLMSYHRALLDERGAYLLVREFYRAYLADGSVPGGERRPDIRDHADWVAGRGIDGARRFWTAAGPPRHAAVSPGRPGGVTHQGGTGRVQRRLRPHHTARLRDWAALQGAGESSVLHAVWALLLYRAAGTRGPSLVSFDVHFSGRDLALRDAAAVPGLLGSALPMTVTVDPATPVEELLWQVRDAVLDLSAYAWVSGDRVRGWSGRGDDPRLTDTLVRFDSRPELPPALLSELAARDIEVDVPREVGTDTSLPVTLVAQHDAVGGLLLTATHDRAELSDADAAQTLSQCVHLLRSLSERSGPGGTVGEVLALLENSEVPRVARHSPVAPGAEARVLRRGGPHADVICLITVPGVAPGTHEALVRAYDGPEHVVTLSPGEPADALPAAVTRLLGPRGRLVVCGSGPAACVAYAIGRAQASATTATTVVMTGVGDAESSADALARALVRRRARDG
ncbi:condensation domain-containing protein [Streptomyces sp. NPDC102406]|uniref:condensation domain-containing protein n=1 Tax=Streptomyces sp. NPDC102406 TaxID=3366171 RepID=UPI00380E9FA5